MSLIYILGKSQMLLKKSMKCSLTTHLFSTKISDLAQYLIVHMCNIIKHFMVMFSCSYCFAKVSNVSMVSFKSEHVTVEVTIDQMCSFTFNQNPRINQSPFVS